MISNLGLLRGAVTVIANVNVMVLALLGSKQSDLTHNRGIALTLNTTEITF
jgi:hypothetical protein